MTCNNAYNKLQGYEMIPYNIISYLIFNNENMWKLLKYQTPDALDQPNLTQEEKGELVYNAQEPDSSGYSVFLFEGTDDAYIDQTSQLRVFNLNTDFDNRTVGIQDVCFLIVVHNKVNMLNNYSTRLENIIKEIIETLNGVDINVGLGVLFGDNSRRRTTGIRKGFQLGNNKNFLGAQIVLACNISGE